MEFDRRQFWELGRNLLVFAGGYHGVAGAQATVSTARRETAPESDALTSANVGFVQSGTGVVARTVQSKLRDTVSAYDFGAVGDGSDETDHVQLAVDSLPAEGGTVVVPNGVRFQLKALVRLRRVAIDYRIDDDGSTGLPGTRLGSGERVHFLATSDYAKSSPSGGAVNEWRFTAPFHPGLVVDIRKDVAGADAWLNAGQSRTPARGSIFVSDEQLSMFGFRYNSWSGPSYNKFTGGYIQTLRHTITLRVAGVAASAFGQGLAVKDRVRGNSSGASGYVRQAPGADTLVLQWESGQFTAGETLTHLRSANVSGPIALPRNHYKQEENAGLWFDLWTGAVSCGAQGSGNAVEMWNLDGNSLTVPSASSSLNRIAERTKPVHWFARSTESVATSKVGIGLEVTAGSDGQRRLSVYDHDEATAGALIPSSAKFHMVGRAQPAYAQSGGDHSYNTRSATRTAAGKYTVLFASEVRSASYTVVAALDADHMGGWTYAVRGRSVGGFEIWFRDGGGGLADLPKNAEIQVLVIGGDL